MTSKKEKMESDAEVEEKNICEDELIKDGKITEDSEEYEKEEEIFSNVVNVKGELVTNVSVDITKMKDEVNNNDGIEIKNIVVQRTKKEIITISVSQQWASSSRATILNTERIVRNSFVEQIMRLRLF